MRRFFVESELISNDEIAIIGELEHYLSDVLRLKIGALIELSDGEKEICTVKLTEFAAGVIKGEISERRAFSMKSKVEIYLYQGLPKGDKLEFIVQKCTELGVSGIIPIEMPRSVVRIIKDKSAKKTARLQKIATEAAQQSKQDVVPQISEPLSWQEFLRETESLAGLTLVLWEDEKFCGLKDALVNYAEVGRINLIIGPEGGLGAEEAEELKKRGAISVSLGRKILRTETAPIAALAMIGYHYGDLGVI